MQILKLKLNITNDDDFKNRPRLNPEMITKWTEALRSGEYKQGGKSLRSGECFCCLGVLCEILEIKPVLDNGIYKYDGAYNALTGRNKLFPELSNLGDFKGFRLTFFDGDKFLHESYPSLAILNDSLNSDGSFRYSFDLISKVIETFWGPENIETWEIEI